MYCFFLRVLVLSVMYKDLPYTFIILPALSIHLHTACKGTLFLLDTQINRDIYHFFLLFDGITDSECYLLLNRRYLRLLVVSIPFTHNRVREERITFNFSQQSTLNYIFVPVCNSFTTFAVVKIMGLSGRYCLFLLQGIAGTHY